MEHHMPSTKGLYESVTAHILSELEKGVRPWTAAWKKTGKGSLIPVNASTGRPYSGMNILLLWMEAMNKGYPTHGWMTFKQANDLGAKVRKGEKSATVVFTTFKPKGDEPDAKMVPVLKSYSVFNTSQLEGLPDKYDVKPEVLPADVRLDALQSLVTASGITVNFGHDQPAYYPKPDRVVMPQFSAFNSADDYASTLAHELVHATGAEHRLNRKLSSKVFKTDYAAEELIAELGSCFLMSHLQFDYVESQSPAYIDGWLKVLKADNRAIFSIASYASQAADWLRSREHALVPETVKADDMADQIPY